MKFGTYLFLSVPKNALQTFFYEIFLVRTHHETQQTQPLFKRKVLSMRSIVQNQL